jgi:hypothetical protein
VDWEENLEQWARELKRSKELEAQYGIRFAEAPTVDTSMPADGAGEGSGGG